MKHTPDVTRPPIIPVFIKRKAAIVKHFKRTAELRAVTLCGEPPMYIRKRCAASTSSSKRSRRASRVSVPCAPISNCRPTPSAAPKSTA